MFSPASFTLIPHATKGSGATASDQRKDFLLGDGERFPDSHAVLAKRRRYG
jgi:hypothetical protein